MSYFGVSGPAQDGGFIAGIGAGATRLQNARASRARYAKSMGAINAEKLKDFYLPDVLQENQGRLDDSILYSRAQDVSESYNKYQEAAELYNSGKLTAADYDKFKAQYLQDRKMIEQWAESGPYVHEGKAIALSSIVILGIATYFVLNSVNRQKRKRSQGRKSAFYGVFS